MINIPNLVNLHAEIGADLIGNDAEPALTISNTGTGPGLRTLGLVTQSTASIDVAYIPTLQGGAAGSNPVTIQRTVPGSISVGVLRISGNSTASQAVLEFYQKGFLSITSTVLTTVANSDYAIVVQVGLETRYLPLWKAAAIIGAAAYA